MKTALKFISITLFLTLFFACQQGTPSQQEDDTDRAATIARIDSVAQAYYAMGHLVGFAIAVLHDGDTLYNKAFGYANLDQKIPATAETKFGIASVTKLHTATAAMKLVDEGKLSLDQTLLEWMPDFPRPEQAKKITIRHLLSHTSGLMDYAEHVDSLFIQEKIQPTRQTYLDYLATQDLQFEPGTSFSYTNTGFNLMAFIIEKASGMLYEDFIEKTIAEPLGLTSLKHLNRNFGPGNSRRYQLADSNFEKSDIDSVFYFKGDGGLSATALDLAHVPFGLADGKIISQQSLAEMMKTFSFPDGNRIGYGLGMRTGNYSGHRVWGHTGGHRNYFSTLAFFPEHRISIAVLNNTDDAPVDALWIEGDIAMTVLGLKAPDLNSLEQTVSGLEKYEGTYNTMNEAYFPDAGTEFKVNPEDGHLYRKRKGSASKGEKLYYLGDDTFAYEKFPMDRTVFNLNENNIAVGYQDYYNGLFLALKKKVE